MLAVVVMVAVGGMGVRAGVGMGMLLAAVAVVVTAEWDVIENGVHAGHVRTDRAAALDDRVLEDDAENPGGGHHVSIVRLASETHISSSTHSRLIIVICAAGPPQARKPNLRKRMKIAPIGSGRSTCWIPVGMAANCALSLEAPRAADNTPHGQAKVG